MQILPRLKERQWRINHLYKITNKQNRKIKFRENVVQRYVRECGNKRKKILKARQLGITTGCLIYLLDTVLFYKNRNACILAHKQDALETIFRVVRLAFDCLPDELKPVLDRGGGSKFELFFPKNNSRIYTALEVRGGTIHDLHVSEAAFIDFDRLQATLDAVPIHGRVTFETTANGFNHFRRRWFDRDDGYDSLFFPWFFDPTYRIETNPLIRTDNEKAFAAFALEKFNMVISDEQLAFRRFKVKEKQGLELFLQEYPEDDMTCFLTSGSNPFDMLKLQEVLERCTDPIRYVDGIEILVEPNMKYNYVIGADVAEGVRSDFSVATVICVQTMEQVAFFRSNRIDPGDFGDLLYKLAGLYSYPGRIALIICERNNHGHATLLKLKQLGANLWLDQDEKPGHVTSRISRPLLIDLFIDAVKNDTFLIRSKQIISECQTLVDNKGKIEAVDGEHDDSVISCALAFKIALKQASLVSIYRNLDKSILI